MASITKHPAFLEVVRALQQAEEISGPEGPDYIQLQYAVAMLCTGRAMTYSTVEPHSREALAGAARALIERLEADVKTLSALPAVPA